MTDIQQYLRPFNCVQKRAQACLRMLSTKWVYKSYIYLTYMYKLDLALNNLQQLIYHKTKPNAQPSVYTPKALPFLAMISTNCQKLLVGL